MKKTIIAASLLALAVSATAAQAGVDFRVNIGVPAPVLVSGGYPVAPEPVVVASSPRFIYSPELGYYVSVGTPYDMVYVDNSYYRYSGGSWYLASTYGGPWSHVPRHRMPHALRGHSYQEVRYYRDHEFRRYQHDRDHYRGRWFTPGAVERVDYRRDHDGGRWNHDGGRWNHDGGRWDRDGGRWDRR